MANKAAIISAADQRYFPLLRGLIQSLRDQGCADAADLCVIDLGLAPEQRAELAPLVTSVADGGWDLDFPSRDIAPRWFQAMVARPHLPAYFPGYDIYAWIDADAWVADNRAVGLLLSAARQEGLVLVPEIHASYRWYQVGPEWPPRQNVHRCYRSAWGEAVATKIDSMPVLNSGVFAMPRRHPCWEKWSARLREGLQKSTHMLIEQGALNLAVYLDGITFAPLPAWCNWVCHQAMPRYSAAAKRFEEPMRPYFPISILHTGDYKHSAIKLPSPGRELIDVPFTYSALKDGGYL